MANKPIRIGVHARFEMQRRSITEAQIRAVIRRPGQILSVAHGRQIYQSLIGRSRRMLLRVIVKENPQAYYVVTAYKTSRIAKYWSQS